MCGIDAVGYQARDRNNPSRENPTQALNDLIRLIKSQLATLELLAFSSQMVQEAPMNMLSKKNVCLLADNSGKRA